ncbi:MAG: crossover junction endodeoxyribonuclease RuvC [Pseudomonadota bacterium]
MSTRLRILGIDPGIQSTGFGIIDVDAGALSYVTSGRIRTTGKDMPPRLREIFEGVAGLIAEYQPNELAIERVFMHRNADSALKLGHARSAALCAAMSDEQTQPAIHEYAAREIKLAVVGSGAAVKSQVSLMVRSLLSLSGELQSDAADALGVAVCHANARRARARIRNAGRPA